MAFTSKDDEDESCSSIKDFLFLEDYKKESFVK